MEQKEKKKKHEERIVGEEYRKGYANFRIFQVTVDQNFVIFWQKIVRAEWKDIAENAAAKVFPLTFPLSRPSETEPLVCSC